jgi:hypothetical protein
MRGAGRRPPFLLTLGRNLLTRRLSAKASNQANGLSPISPSRGPREPVALLAPAITHIVVYVDPIEYDPFMEGGRALFFGHLNSRTEGNEKRKPPGGFCGNPGGFWLARDDLNSHGRWYARQRRNAKKLAEK